MARECADYLNIEVAEYLLHVSVRALLYLDYGSLICVLPYSHWMKERMNGLTTDQTGVSGRFLVRDFSQRFITPYIAAFHHLVFLELYHL